MAILILTLNYLARNDLLSQIAIMLWPNADYVYKTLKARGAAVGMFFFYLAFASIYFPNTLMVRPHPIFWRLVLAIFFAYSMGMTYLLLLPKDEARQALTYVDAGLGKPLEEVLYAEDCRIYTPENPESKFANIYFAVFDIHFLAHLGGWFGKMLIMRDWYVCWICSIVFEFLELTFKTWLPNFAECWWD